MIWKSPQNAPDAPGLSIGLRVRTCLRSLGLQGSWNNQRMQNLGLLTSLLPWHRRQPRAIDRDRLFCRRYYEFFNTNPYLANFIIGGLLRLEQDRADGMDHAPGMTTMFRDSVGRALASLGDQLFWLGVRPALLTGLCILAIGGWIWAILGLLAVFTGAQLWLRWRALDLGYRLGFELVDLLQNPAWHRAIRISKRSGMVLLGLTGGLLLGISASQGDRMAHGLAWMGWGLGLGLPLALGKRFPGEIQVLLALGLTLLLAFAIQLLGS